MIPKPRGSFHSMSNNCPISHLLVSESEGQIISAIVHTLSFNNEKRHIAISHISHIVTKICGWERANFTRFARLPVRRTSHSVAVYSVQPSRMPSARPRNPQGIPLKQGRVGILPLISLIYKFYMVRPVFNPWLRR